MEETSEDKKQEWGLPSIGIPAEILFNPLFTNSEKLLFGFIKNLSYQPKGCFATNNYLGKLVGMTKTSVSRSISKFYSAKYITIENIGPENHTKRIIKTNPEIQKIYSEIIELACTDIKNLKDWQTNNEIIVLSKRIMGVDIVDKGYNHSGQPPLSERITNEVTNENIKGNGEEIIVSKETIPRHRSLQYA